jgi:hypothetical protein
VFVDRQWSRIGIRVTSVGLLVGGLAGGVSIGRHQAAPAPDDRAVLVVQADVAEARLLKERQAEHAAARASRRAAEDEAATKAAAEAKAAAGRARRLERKTAEKAELKRRAANGTVPYAGPIPASCGQFSGNRATGCALLLQAGFGISQFPCLDKLWTKESGWNHRAVNSGSGAYGIPQAYPGTKMSSVGADWRTNPATQITWGLGYIKGRYKTPCGAWSRSQSAGSY